MHRKKIAFIGNIANNFFREVSALQGLPDFESHLILFEGADDVTARPESDIPEIEFSYPSWIRTLPAPSFSRREVLLFALGFRRPLRRTNTKVVEQLSAYDLCVVSSHAIRLAPFLESLTVFRATGADLTVRPLFSLRDRLALKGKEIDAWPIRKRLRKELWHWAFRRLDSVAIRSADVISHGGEKPFVDALKALRIPTDRVAVPGLRLAVDTATFAYRADAIATSELRWGIPLEARVVLLPSRIVIDNRPSLRRSGQWKASDVAIRGFRKALDRIDSDLRGDYLLAIPDRSRTPGLSEAKSLIQDLGLTRNVVFLSGKHEDALTRDELIDAYSRSDVVLDDFGVGWYGSIVVESLACGTPVITHVADEVLAQFEWNPILIAKTPDEVALQLLEVLSCPPESENRATNRRWVLENHSVETYAQRSAPLLQAWLARSSHH